MLVLVISHFTMKSEKGFSDGFLPILGHLILHHALPIFFSVPFLSTHYLPLDPYFYLPLPYMQKHKPVIGAAEVTE